ncbi:aromatic motif membrane protein [Mycoplasma buteonis]|uniref:aromatic motif membrane protein n=1 Tax=Mycoplasma buteonis TaxID=171280 RepID=UPI000562257D|nr:aromatic motif membrane protein [Mycoplasma buteonis]
MKNKLLQMLLFSSPVLLTASCANYQSQEKFKDLIDPNFDYHEVGTKNQEKHNKSIMDTLLNLVFKSDTVARTEFLTEQNSDVPLENFKKIIKKYSSIFEKQKQMNLELAKLNEDLKRYSFLAGQFWKELQETRAKIAQKNQEIQSLNAEFENYNSETTAWASTNWYYFLLHLDEFKFNFLKFIGSTFENIPVVKDNFPSYLDKFKSEFPPSSYQLTDNFLGNMIIGSESQELGDTNVYYLNKDKLVFRIRVVGISRDRATVKIDPLIWYFPNLKAPKISLNLISSIYHYGFIHGSKEHYKQFIEDMVKKQRYGEPVYIYLTLKKEQANEEN